MKPLLQRIAHVFSGQPREDQNRIIGAIAPVYMPVLDRYKISTPLRVAHFTAQIMHESAGMRTTEEFASGEAYEGRDDLGNVVKGDGVKYKGRGLIQLTGRTNYRRFGRYLHIDLISDPERAAEPITSLNIACEYWRRNGLNELADQDDVLLITQRINGGTNGLADREKYLERAKSVLAVGQEGRLLKLERPYMTGLDVYRVQRKIYPHSRDIDFRDGVYGPMTEYQVKFVQQQACLEIDGIVGPKTREVLGL